MKYLKSCGYLVLAGIMAGVCGCASTIDSLSNNTSSDMVRGVKFQGGVDASSGNPVPSVTFTMGSVARKGKGDRTVVVIDNNTTDIVSENYQTETVYHNVDNKDSSKPPRQFIESEKRMPVAQQLDEGILVNQTNSLGMGITAGNLFSHGGGTMISVGKVGPNTPLAILNAKVKPQDVGTVATNESAVLQKTGEANPTGSETPGTTGTTVPK